jgi:hypothetical protein
MIIVNLFTFNTIKTPLFTIPYFPDNIRTNDLLFFSEEPLKQLLINVRLMFDAAIWQKPDLPWNSIPEFGSLYLCTLPFVVTGIYVVIRQIVKSNDNFGYICVLGFLLAGLWAGMITPVNINRINIIFYPLIILAGFGIHFMITYIRFSQWVALAAYLTLFAGFSLTYFTGYADMIKARFFYDFGRAVKHAGMIDCDRYYITPHSQYTGSAQVSEILTMFYHEIDAEYFQGKRTLNNKNGKQLLPYRERYNYFISERLLADKTVNTSYVIRGDEIRIFDPNDFQFTRFNSYFVVVPAKQGALP